MTSANGLAAVAQGGAVQTRGAVESEDFLGAQLRSVRMAAGEAANELAVACLGDTPPHLLGDIAQRAILAAAEVRIAARAFILAHP
jgi:hypothetical protein